eukprot:5081131-Amphidinium_carterae.2
MADILGPQHALKLRIQASPKEEAVLTTLFLRAKVAPPCILSVCPSTAPSSQSCETPHLDIRNLHIKLQPIQTQLPVRVINVLDPNEIRGTHTGRKHTLFYPEMWFQVQRSPSALSIPEARTLRYPSSVQGAAWISSHHCNTQSSNSFCMGGSLPYIHVKHASHSLRKGGAGSQAPPWSCSFCRLAVLWPNNEMSAHEGVGQSQSASKGRKQPAG